MSEHRSFVPPTANLKEFTFRAVFIGLLMTVILGAANAYLGFAAACPDGEGEEYRAAQILFLLGDS